MSETTKNTPGRDGLVLGPYPFYISLGNAVPAAILETLPHRS